MDLSAPGSGPDCPEGQDLLARSRETGDALVVSGGPLDAALAWAAAAREVGFTRVTLAVGDVGIDGDGLARARAAGVAAIHMTLWAADPAAHDYHTRVEGSLRAAVATLRAARTIRLPAIVTTSLTRSNARVVPALPGLLVDVAAVGWRVAVPAIAGPFAARFDALAPRLAVALPYALQAIVAAARVGLAAGIAGAPTCLLGPLHGRSVPTLARAFAPSCDGCPARAGCPGVDAAYLRRFAGDELSPRALRASDAPPLGPGLARLFAGPWLRIGEGPCSPI